MVLLLVCLSTLAVAAQTSTTEPQGVVAGATDFFANVKTSIQKHLGRPYVWGATGVKSFDCSGFIWRVMYENGILMKRTTARKFYMMMKPVDKSSEWKFGTLVFFDNLKHVGIVDDPKAFFHAQSSKGTNRSEMNSFWRQKIYGFRQLPVPNP
jgi:cell wall-associated NlpC family hydrolase